MPLRIHVTEGMQVSAMPLYTAALGLVIALFWLGTGTTSAAGRALVRPAVLALACMAVLLLSHDLHLRWPYLLVAGTAFGGVWESYAGVYLFLNHGAVTFSPSKQVKICLVWLSGALTNLGLLNLSVSLAYPGTFVSAYGPADALDVAYFTLLTFSSGGYGDIVPVTALGKGLAMLTSLAGLIYATILFGALFQRLRGE